MNEQPERDVEADVVTVEITPDISRSLAVIDGTRQALAPLVIAELRARLAAVRAIATEMRYRRAAPAITAYGAALLAALDGPDPKEEA